MTLPSDDRRAKDPSQSALDQVLPHFEPELAQHLNTEQMFLLIDGVLPFEACLYHQLIPLYLEGSRLHLGMVSVNDLSAVDYVRRIISYLNYSVVTHRITSTALQSALSAYLNYASKKQAEALKQANPNSSPASSKPKSGSSLGYNNDRRSRQEDLQEKQTLIVDLPDDLDPNELEHYVAAPQPAEAIAATDSAEEIAETDPASVEHQNIGEASSSSDPLSPDPFGAASIEELPDIEHLEEDPIAATESSLAIEQESEPKASSAIPLAMPAIDEKPATDEPIAEPVQAQPVSRKPKSEPVREYAPASSASFLAVSPVLPIHPKYLKAPIETLITLAPKELMGELLGRVLQEGIGRLYLERQKQYGKVLWSKDGMLQSVLEQLEQEQFQAVVNELKLLAQIPLVSIKKLHQTEMIRMYDNDRVMLRFRFMPGAHGEEVTIQVLRGAALEFYQQQVIDKLGRDALSIAQQLQGKLDELRVRADHRSNLETPHKETLSNLRSMLRSLEEQLRTLESSQSDTQAPSAD